MTGHLSQQDIMDVSSSQRLLYREDDANFKRRMNTAIQLSWVYNSVITILVVLAIFFFLELNLIMGILLGVLIAILSNFHLTVTHVVQACHWEIYKNRVVMPRGIMGSDQLIMFADIETVERREGVLRDLLVIKVTSGETYKVDMGGQEKPVEAFELAFRQFYRVRMRRQRTVDENIQIREAT